MNTRLNLHPKWKQDRCKLCAAGVPLRDGYRIGHNISGAPECTAPEPEDYILELEAKLQAAIAAVKAYIFTEQTLSGLNPHKAGTNRHRAFELGRAAIIQMEGKP